jgi:predicted ester cyclase
MATEQERNKALVLQMYDEVWNKGNIDFVNAAVAPGFKDHPLKRFYQLPTEGRAAISEAASNFRGAITGLNYQMIQVVSENDRVVSVGRVTGTHANNFFQVAPSHKPINVTGFFEYRLENGKIVECWGGFDVMGLMQQMGMIPGAPGGH